MIGIGARDVRISQEATLAKFFWEMLYERRCTMTEFPQDSFNTDTFYNRENSGSGTVSSVASL